MLTLDVAFRCKVARALKTKKANKPAFPLEACIKIV